MAANERLHAAGVTILAGSDTQAHAFPGSALPVSLQQPFDYRVGFASMTSATRTLAE